MSKPAVTITLRIPCQWAHTKELGRRLPDGCRPTPDALELDDGTRAEFGAVPADDQTAAVAG